MGRLIDENSAIEIAEKCTFTDENERRKYLDFVRYCVEQSKTAYNVEKVVEELEENQSYYAVGENEWDCAKYQAFNSAIEIVRKGGVE